MAVIRSSLGRRRLGKDLKDAKEPSMENPEAESRGPRSGKPGPRGVPGPRPGVTRVAEAGQHRSEGSSCLATSGHTKLLGSRAAKKLGAELEGSSPRCPWDSAPPSTRASAHVPPCLAGCPSLPPALGPLNCSSPHLSPPDVSGVYLGVCLSPIWTERWVQGPIFCSFPHC